MHDQIMTVDHALTVLGGLHDRIPLQSISEHADNLASLGEQTRHGLSAAQRPFRIMLIGGTGVGKSTVLNALAGSAIAETGSRRPTTEGFNIYLHEDDNDPWLHTLHKAHFSTHSRSELRGKAVIDSPDVDSVITDHRRILEEALGLVDLALVIMTPEKYVSDAVIRIIERYRHGRSFAFVFNKRDLNPEQALLDDLRQFLMKTSAGSASPHHPPPKTDSFRVTDQIFHISAQSAFEARMIGEEVGEDFRELEGWVGEKLHRHQLAEIVRINLEQRIGMIIGFVRRILPPGWETVDTEWRNGCASRFADYLRELSDVLQRDLFRSDDIADAIAEIRGSSFGGFYGIISDVVYAARAFRRSRLLSRIDGADRWIKNRMSSEEWERFTIRDRFVFTSCMQFGTSLGISQSFLQDTFVQQWEQSEKVSEWLRPDCVDGLARNLEKESGKPGFFFNFLENIPAFAWFAYWVYRIVDAVMRGESPPWDAIPGAAVVLGFFLLFQWWLTGRFLRWEAKRRGRRVISSILSAIEARYLQNRETAVEAVASALRKSIDRYRLALDTLERTGRNDD